MCARSVVEETLVPKSSEYIPLGLIDWLSENKNKVDKGPFLTTVLILESIMLELLEDKHKAMAQPLTPPDDGSGDADVGPPDDVSAELSEWVSRRFGAKGEDFETIKTQIQRCVDSELPVTWEQRHMEIFQRLFMKKWRPVVVTLFSKVSPYKELMQYSASKDLLSPEFVSLYANTYINRGQEAKKRADLLKEELKDTDPRFTEEKFLKLPLAHIEHTIKADGKNVFFLVVFQKALFRAFRTVSDQRPALGISEGASGDKKILETFVAAMNELCKNGLSDISDKTAKTFWTGIALKADDNVDYSAGGCERISRWLAAWTLMQHSYSKKTIPVFKGLKEQDDGVGPLLDRLLARGPSLKGFKATLRAAEKDDSDEAAVNLAQKRYDILSSFL